MSENFGGGGIFWLTLYIHKPTSMSSISGVYSEYCTAPNGVGDGVAAARPPTGDGVKPDRPWPWPGSDAPSEFTGEGRGGGGRVGNAAGRGGFCFCYYIYHNMFIITIPLAVD